MVPVLAVHHRSWLPCKIRTTYEVNYSLLQLSRNFIDLIYCFLFCLLSFGESQQHAPIKGHIKLCTQFNNFIYKVFLPQPALPSYSRHEQLNLISAINTAQKEMHTEDTPLPALLFGMPKWQHAVWEQLGRGRIST